MFDNISYTLSVASVALFILALLLLAVSTRLFRRSRTDVFWRRRRDAGRRGWRALVLACVLILLSGLLCVFTFVAALVSENDAITPTTAALVSGEPQTALPVAEAPTDLTGAAVNTPVETPTPIVIIITATPVYTPTRTPFPTYASFSTPLVAGVAASPDAAIRITAIDDRISDVLMPVNPRAAFPAGVTRIYFFVEYADMMPGVVWRRELYRDAILIDGGSYRWGLETDGTSYFFFGNDSGFAPGNYDIRLFIGDSSDPANMASFTIVKDMP